MKRLVNGDWTFICGRWPLDQSKSTLVFIHGAGESSLLWHAQVESLSPRANTVALDLPGHGGSRGSSHSTVPDYASDVVKFIGAIAAPKPIACGLSMGGAITQQLLLDHCAHFQAGIIISSGARLKVQPELFEMIQTDMVRFVEMVDRLGFSTQTEAAVKKPFLEDSLKAQPQVVFGDFKACHAFDVMARLDEPCVSISWIPGISRRLNSRRR